MFQRFFIGKEVTCHNRMNANWQAKRGTSVLPTPVAHRGKSFQDFFWARAIFADMENILDVKLNEEDADSVQVQ